MLRCRLFFILFFCSVALMMCRVIDWPPALKKDILKVIIFHCKHTILNCFSITDHYLRGGEPTHPFFCKTDHAFFHGWNWVILDELSLLKFYRMSFMHIVYLCFWFLAFPFSSYTPYSVLGSGLDEVYRKWTLFLLLYLIFKLVKCVLWQETTTTWGLDDMHRIECSI